jgi:serine/threonine-protein kinase
MPAPTSCAELLDWLESNQLLSPAQAREICPTLAGYADPKQLARELIGRDWLSPYQVNQILQGKGDQLILGWLRLRERLGEGAMGQVFKAWNTRLQKVVAVKTLHKELVANSRAMDRFRQEVEAASQLDHANIVRVRDADDFDGRPYLVMDYIDGVNLSYLVKTKGPLPITVAVECARQAALGLQHAFERGVVHRDVKPGNLLLEVTRGEGRGARDEPTGIPASLAPRVRILDFGLARFDSERRYSTRLTQVGSTLGTVDYMAPEQAESARDADCRADIYGLGCTLFFLLTGRPPFPGASMAEKIGARLTSAVPPSVRAQRPEVSEGLDRVLTRMMARQPADRYQTPAEVAAALEPFTQAAAPVDDPIPLAEPVEAAPEAPVPVAPPVDVELFPAVLGHGLAHASTEESVPARRSSPPVARGPGWSPRLVYALVGAGAVAFLLFAGCTACVLTRFWPDGKAHADAYPAGAALMISEAEFSTPFIRPGERKFLNVKIQRKDFEGPVELRLTGLPPGISTDDRVVIKAGMNAASVGITVPFGTVPTEAEIRVIAAAKNLSAEKQLSLRIGEKR